MSYVLHIKNAVCNRCNLAIEGILQRLEISYRQISVGEVHLDEEPEKLKKDQLKSELEAIGLGLIDDRINQLIEKTKQLILLKARNEVTDSDKNQKLSYYLTHKLLVDYSYLSNLFTSIERRNIQSFFVEQRIEKAKELLVYGELTLSEIAHELEYSSVAHLSSQFKKITGLTPSDFKHIEDNRLKSLDQV